MPDSLLNNEQAAQFLGLSSATLNKYRVHGCGPQYVKIGARVFYERGELETFVAERRRRSTSDRGVQQ